MTTKDFRATQIQTSQIISSGSSSTGAKIVVYNISGQSTSNPNQGIIDPTLFNTSSIGTDIFLFVSGASGERGTANANSIGCFGGDLHVSGNLTVGGTSPGGGSSFFFSNTAGIVETTGSLLVSSSVVVQSGGLIVKNSAVPYVNGVAIPTDTVMVLPYNGKISAQQSGTVGTITDILYFGADPTSNNTSSILIGDPLEPTLIQSIVLLSSGNGGVVIDYKSGSSIVIPQTGNGFNIGSTTPVARATDYGNDIFFHVSGTIVTGSNTFLSVFGGSVRVSGALGVGSASTNYLSSSGADLKFFDGNNTAGWTLTQLAQSGSASGGGGSLQLAYNTGSVISQSNNVPISITGSNGAAIIDIAPDPAASAKPAIRFSNTSNNTNYALQALANTTETVRISTIGSVGAAEGFVAVNALGSFNVHYGFLNSTGEGMGLETSPSTALVFQSDNGNSIKFQSGAGFTMSQLFTGASAAVSRIVNSVSGAYSASLDAVGTFRARSGVIFDNTPTKNVADYGSNVSFFASGSVGGITQSIPGVAVFGGDINVSGNVVYGEASGSWVQRQLVTTTTTGSESKTLWTYILTSSLLYDMDLTILATGTGSGITKRFKRNLSAHGFTTPAILESSVFVPVPDVSGSSGASAFDINFRVTGSSLLAEITGSVSQSTNWLLKAEITRH